MVRRIPTGSNLRSIRGTRTGPDAPAFCLDGASGPTRRTSDGGHEPWALTDADTRAPIRLAEVSPIQKEFARCG